MKRSNQLLLVALLAALLVWSTGAQDQPVKIGVVDMDQAFSSTDEGKSVRDELARKQREAEAQLQPMLDRFRDLQEEVKAKRFVLSDDALFQRQVELAELQNKLDTRFKELEGQLKIDQGRMIAPLRNRMLTIIETIGKEQGFTLILGRDAPGVMYTREALDITDMVIQRFNRG